MSTILITGGTGLLGKAIRKRLLAEGHQLRILSREKRSSKNPKEEFFTWDLSKRTIDSAAFEGLNVIIHLAGTSVAEGPWTETRKKEIIRSRIASAQLLLDSVKSSKTNLDLFISASGVAYYGTKTSDVIFKEDAELGSGFLSEVTEQWESAADTFLPVCKRVAKVRISTVLSRDGGALPKLMQPVNWGFGSAIGSGRQWFPWIHINDLANLFSWLVKENKAGVYNACAPEGINNHDFTKVLAKKMRRPFFMPPVPTFVLQLVLGKQMANEIILNGSRISSQKAMDEGFTFDFHNVGKALEDLLG